MTSTEFAAIGKAIYGDRWIPPFAAALGTNHRTVARYSNRTMEIPEEVAERARALMRICASGRNRAEQRRSE